MNKTIGILLIIAGAAMLIWTGFTYTKKEKIIDAGPIQYRPTGKKRLTGRPTLVGYLLLARCYNSGFKK